MDIGAWDKADTGQHVRNICYVKHLNNAIGPKLTKCHLKEQVDHLDLQNYVTQVTTTQTPDVPSGNSFRVKTRVCLMWAGQNKVRMLVTVVVEFSKSSWLKCKVIYFGRACKNRVLITHTATIEKASIDGQVTYFKNLDSAIRQHIQPSSIRSPAAAEKRLHRHNPHQRRRRRQHVRNHSRADQYIHGKRTKSIYDTLLESFKAGASAGAEWVMQNPAPSTNQIIVACLVFLLCINVIIAVKLESIGRKMVERNNITSKDTNPWEMHADKVWQWLDTQPTAMSKCVWELEQLVQHAEDGIEELMRQQQQQQHDAARNDYFATSPGAL